MIKLYTNKRKRRDLEWLLFIDDYFDRNISLNNLTRSDMDLMQKLENIVVVDEERNMVKTNGTPFPLIYISTGLKTLIIIRYLKRNNINNVLVDITGCGSNIIEYIFEEITDGSVPIILRHSDLWELKKDRVILINDKIVVRTIHKLINEIIKAT